MDVVSPEGQSIADNLRELYARSVVMTRLLEAIGPELDAHRAAIEEIRDQQFVETATWGLDWWESFFGVDPRPGATTAERREKIVGKLRSSDVTVNKATVKRVAESFQNGVVTVEDVNDNPAAGLPDYTVRITFTAPGGAPPNVEILQATLRELIPAHLAITYAFNFLTWAELDAQGWTWAELDAMNLTWAELEVFA